MKISKLPLVAALALLASSVLATEKPNTADLALTGNAGTQGTAAAVSAVDLEKIDYLLLTEKRDGSFDAYNTRTLGAFEAEVKAGNAEGVAASTDLAGVKALQDKAYEAFLAALADLRRLTGVDVASAGTAGLAQAVSALTGKDASGAVTAEASAAKAASHVLELRAVYRTRANGHAKKLLASR